ncbi:MAG: hypothetical protein HON47_03895 [Candidatus Diapherotrites archaeon]|jgi:hypothetical protein|uniref:DUF2341 domain-containing protein n=1 Tax=Candidatus Iainarchaeum sp. TaxID=3101447 RepID=A0A8T5GFU0_9ARCH|nr:hypothetical protein [Candidatus Diapherotrites archaeon]MBT7241523.1 hypothetical protein [Candidatus Diapherotrites archaeon]
MKKFIFGVLILLFVLIIFSGFSLAGVVNPPSGGSWIRVSQPSFNGQPCGSGSYVSGYSHYCGTYFSNGSDHDDGCGCWKMSDGRVGVYCCDSFGGQGIRTCEKHFPSYNGSDFSWSGGDYSINCTGACTNLTWYKDQDGDDYSNGATLTSCDVRPNANYFLSSELIATSGDCVDTNPNINPGETEICNGIDDDCLNGPDDGFECVQGSTGCNSSCNLTCYDGTPSTIIDHGGADWIISSDSQIVGKHTNIGNFRIDSGIIATVKPFDGTNCGLLDINANNIIINGKIDATGAGYGGGAGGGGGGGNNWHNRRGSIGSGGIAGQGGTNGSSGSNPSSIEAYANHSGKGGNGGAGAGSFAGIIGTGGSWVGWEQSGNSGGNGGDGKYCNGLTSNCDLTETLDVNIGSGGAGGGGGSGAGGEEGSCTGQPGGGGGAAGGNGGGSVILKSNNTIMILGEILTKGTLGENGEIGGNRGCSPSRPGDGGDGGSSLVLGNGIGGAGRSPEHLSSGSGGNGGAGAGGGILLWSPKEDGITINGNINTLNGSDQTSYGGTLKIFYCNSYLNSGTLDYGRFFEGDSCEAIESCNGIDDDGDTLVDEDFECIQNSVDCDATCMLDSGGCSIGNLEFVQTDWSGGKEQFTFGENNKYNSDNGFVSVIGTNVGRIVFEPNPTGATINGYDSGWRNLLQSTLNCDYIGTDFQPSCDSGICPEEMVDAAPGHWFNSCEDNVSNRPYRMLYENETNPNLGFPISAGDLVHHSGGSLTIGLNSPQSVVKSYYVSVDMIVEGGDNTADYLDLQVNSSAVQRGYDPNHSSSEWVWWSCYFPTKFDFKATNDNTIKFKAPNGSIHLDAYRITEDIPTGLPMCVVGANDSTVVGNKGGLMFSVMDLGSRDNWGFLEWDYTKNSGESIEVWFQQSNLADMSEDDWHNVSAGNGSYDLTSFTKQYGRFWVGLAGDSSGSPMLNEVRLCKLDTTIYCDGVVPVNASLIALDENIDLQWIASVVLVDSNTSEKCEAVCDTGYHRVDQTCEVDVGGSCVGDIPSNAIICADDDTGVSGNVTRTLVGDTSADCSITKCEYYCASGMEFNGSACVPQTVGEWTCSGTKPEGEGIVTGAEEYLVSAYTPKQWTYNPSAMGDMNCEWKCDTGYTRSGNECVTFGNVDVNNIEFLNLSLNDKNIIAEIQCSSNIVGGEIEIFDEEDNGITSEIIFFTQDGQIVQSDNLDCNTLPVKYVLQSNSYVDNHKYLINATIPQTCNICLRSGYIFYEANIPVTIPDANLLIAILIAVSAVFIVSKKRI